jgi:hypothetical protein
MLDFVSGKERLYYTTCILVSARFIVVGSALIIIGSIIPYEKETLTLTAMN